MAKIILISNKKMYNIFKIIQSGHRCTEKNNKQDLSKTVTDLVYVIFIIIFFFFFSLK